MALLRSPWWYISLLLAFSSCLNRREVQAFTSIAGTASRCLHHHLSFAPMETRRLNVRLSFSERRDQGLKKDISLSNEWNEDDEQRDVPRKSGSGGGVLGSIRQWFQSDEAREDIKTYFLSLFIALLLRFTVVEPRFIPSLSMYPTFQVGDQLAVEKVTKLVKPLYRNEVVVFNPPKSFVDLMENQYGDKQRGKEALIKRIVAVEGDRVEVKKGKLYVNGEQQDEPFVAEDAEYQFGPVVVPSGNVLVLGDNRNHSLDGHIWGFLPTKNVIGRAVFVYWPPWRLGSDGMY